MKSSQDIEFLEKLLSRSSAFLKSEFGSDRFTIREKSDSSLVTDVDLACDKMIVDAIHEAFPADIVLSEEGGLTNDKRVPGTRIWIVDPLDGTTNFANRYPFFSVSIGCGRFNSAGEIVMELGGIADPIRERIYLAERGQGATCNGRMIRAAKPRPFKDCFLVTGFYYFTGNDLTTELARLAKVSEHCQSVRRDGSAALDMALCAEGVYDAFWERGLKPWDVAAGSILIEEAGGHLENYAKGTSFSVEKDGVICGSSTTVADIRRVGWQ